MCDRCEFGEIIDKAISAGLIVPDGHQAFARMFEDSPAETAQIVSKMASRVDLSELASRAMRADSRSEI
jgi:hypothetical protein